MPYTKFTAAQIQYLRQHYAEQPPTHFAQRWGVEVKNVYNLARRHGIKRRAPNGQPVWRSPKTSANFLLPTSSPSGCIAPHALLQVQRLKHMATH